MRGSKLALGTLMITLAFGPMSGRAQNVTLDEGTFRLTVQGTDVGTETFVIRQTGADAAAIIEASGRVTVDARPQVLTRLSFEGATLRPAEYRLQVSGTPGETVTGKFSGRRVSARIVSSAGENMREYLVSEGAVIIDDRVAYHYYFLARRVRAGETRLPVVVPREGRQTWVNVTIGAEETLTIAGNALAARKLTIKPEQGDERLLWVDTQDRVLRLEIPAAKYVAERTAPPR
jgi:hypothetical protein